MNFLSKASYYLKYLYFNRGDRAIIEYFSSNEFNLAIKDLAQEGFYQVNDIFNDLAKAYSLTTPLNKEESDFINNINRKCNYSKKIYDFPELYKMEIISAKAFVYFYKENKINFDKEYWISLLENELTVLKNIIKKINPITEAVVLRRFVKKMTEKYIKKNIAKIEIQNYFPDSKILESYKKSLSQNYIYRQGCGTDIQSSINMVLKAIKLEESKKKGLKLSKPKLIVLDESDKANELMKVLFKIKTNCNQIIHFESIYKQNVLINEYVMNDSQFNEELEDEEEQNEEQNEENTIHENIQNKNEIIKKNNDIKIISISKIVKFIANGNKDNSSLEKLMKLRKEMKTRVKTLKDSIKTLNDYQISGLIDYKELIQGLKRNIKRDLSSLVLKKYDLDLSDDKIKSLALQFSKNPVNLNDIKIDDDEDDMNKYEGEENDLEYFNGLRRQMNIKDKIKFNITFAYNLAIINYKKTIDNLLPEFNKIDTINNSIQELNNYFKGELDKVIQESQNSDKIIKLINRDGIFVDIKKEEFVSILENEFKDENIDIFEPEINNFYFFVYLLKQGLYDEKSYKSAVDINEDYI